jgi:hypothetical protein
MKKETFERHGMRFSPEYRTWMGLVRRCTNPNSEGYARYAGMLHPEWRESFQAFYQHIGPRPSLKHSIDRIDGTRGYEPGNVRWATPKEQSQNRRTVIWITHAGETLCLADWARKLSLNYSCLYLRIKRRGWSFERAISTPLITRKAALDDATARHSFMAAE